MPKTKAPIDKTLLFTIFLLLLFGLIMIASAGVAYSKVRFGDPYFFFKRQIFSGLLPGLVILYFTQKIHYSFWKKISFPFFVLSVALLTLVFVPSLGSRIYGASRWIYLGNFSFQPSEMLKLSLILYLAAWLESRGEKIKDFFEGLTPFLVVVGIVSFLLLKQPNMGTLGVIIFISLIMFFVSGSSLWHIFLMGIGGLTAFFILIKTEAYRMNRFLVFLHPELDPRGIGYQVNQALLAIGSGGIFGVGLGKSLQKFNYLPEPVGDSIFAIIGEELGLVGCVLVLVLFMILAFRGWRLIQKAPDEFARLTGAGIISWIIVQAFINIAAISGLMPLTGVPLPFISYGGTSLVFLLAGTGILLNISKHLKISKS